MTASCQPQVSTSPVFPPHGHSFASHSVVNVIIVLPFLQKGSNPYASYLFLLGKQEWKCLHVSFSQTLSGCFWPFLISVLSPAGSSCSPHMPSGRGVCMYGYVFKASYLEKYPLKTRFHPLDLFSNINSFLAVPLPSDVDTQKAAHGFTWTYIVGG